MNAWMHKVVANMPNKCYDPEVRKQRLIDSYRRIELERRLVVANTMKESYKTVTMAQDEHLEKMILPEVGVEKINNEQNEQTALLELYARRYGYKTEVDLSKYDDE